MDLSALNCDASVRLRSAVCIGGCFRMAAVRQSPVGAIERGQDTRPGRPFQCGNGNSAVDVLRWRRLPFFPCNLARKTIGTTSANTLTFSVKRGSTIATAAAGYLRFSLARPRPVVLLPVAAI